MNIIVAILALSIIIMIHEIGHYIAAKAVGIRVLEFAIFMGPKLFSFERKGTIYSIRAIPIGGFVSMEGEEKEVDSDTSYSGMPAWKKIVAVSAGPAANFIFALLVLFILFLSSGYALDGNTVIEPGTTAYSAGLRDGDKIISIDGRRVYDPLDLTVLLYTNEGEKVEVKYKSDGEVKTALVDTMLMGGDRYMINFFPVGESTVIGELSENSNGYKAGLRVGDNIISVNGIPVANRDEIDDVMANHQSGSDVIVITENSPGETEQFQFEPVFQEVPEYRDLGIYYSGSRTNVWTALKHSVNFSISTLRAVLMSISWLITGAVKFSEMMGPVGIVSTIGATIKQDTFRLFIINLANMMAFISLNLGLMNLIPFPALDGSKIVIHTIEAIRRKPFPMEKTAWITIAGFVLLVALLLFATFNDIIRLIGL
ncbi:MAG: RIP metalloprotease RseP [Clostridia bacterium]|nr:RIP metalloprotease RseP [Clostridia bacterium]